MRSGSREEVQPDQIKIYVSAGAIHLQTLQISPATPPGCGVPRAPAPRPCWRLRRARRATTFPSPRASPVPTTRSTPCQSRLPPPPLTSVLAALPGRTSMFQCIAADINLKVGTCLTNIVIHLLARPQQQGWYNHHISEKTSGSRPTDASINVG